MVRSRLKELINGMRLVIDVLPSMRRYLFTHTHTPAESRCSAMRGRPSNQSDVRVTVGAHKVFHDIQHGTRLREEESAVTLKQTHTTHKPMPLCGCIASQSLPFLFPFH